MLHHMIRKRAWLDQSPQQMHASWATFRSLCNSHIVCPLLFISHPPLPPIPLSLPSPLSPLPLSLLPSSLLSPSPSLPPSSLLSLPPLPLQKSTLHELQSHCPNGISWDHFLSKLTRHWYAWPFYHQPFWIQTRVLDMYITEGPKVLYRLGLAAVKLFVAHGKHIGEWLALL